MEKTEKTEKKADTKQKMLLKPEAILKYLMGEDKLHTLVTAKSSQIILLKTNTCTRHLEA
jgi:hypothetical protein